MLRSALSLLPYQLVYIFLVVDRSLPAEIQQPQHVLNQNQTEGVSWIDPYTGRKVIRLTEEEESYTAHFNLNIYTPDGRDMIYTNSNGTIFALDLTSLQTRCILTREKAGRNATFVGVGAKSRTVYYTVTKYPLEDERKELFAIDIDTLQYRRVVTLPKYGKAATINSDETLVAGTFVVGEEANKRVKAWEEEGVLVSSKKGRNVEARQHARLPMSLFVINMKTEETRIVLNSTDWLSHLLFSPTDPQRLMYCHEGMWHTVDRIWTMRTDGVDAYPQLVHKRGIPMEIAGHEFWAKDGRTIWYDLQVPRGEHFYLAGYHLGNYRRTRFAVEREEFSIHYNASPFGHMFCGDGSHRRHVARATKAKWIFLYLPILAPQAQKEGAMMGMNNNNINTNATGGQEEGETQTGRLLSIKLVNMTNQNYALEPNTRFSPDGRMIIFRGNMFGRTHVYAVYL